MILTCPECSTRFQIPADSLGEGRTVRCSRCSHRWFQTPEPEETTPLETLAATPPAPSDEVEVEDTAADAGPEPESGREAEAEPATDELPDDAEAEAAASDDDGEAGRADETGEDETGEDEAADDEAPPVLKAERDPFADAPPPPAAARAAARRAAERDGGSSRLATALWVLLFLVVAGVVGSAIGFRQAVMAKWPAAETLYGAVGLGPEPPGAGLGLRNVRWKAAQQGEVAVLRVEGEVANLTDTVRSVPQIEGIIYDKSEKELQRWTFNAPEPRLLPGENVGFVTELKNPAAGAARLQIVFARRKPH